MSHANPSAQSHARADALRQGRGSGTREQFRWWIGAAGSAVALALLFGALRPAWLSGPTQPADEESKLAASSPPVKTANEPAEAAAVESPPAMGEPAKAPAHPASDPASLLALFPDATLEAVERIASLVQSLPTGPASSPEQIAQWKENLRLLTGQKDGAIKAVVEFLGQNGDLVFGGEDREKLGFGSLRAALVDALVEIGGEGAVAGLRWLLQSAAEPREIALLVQGLERLSPGAYRPEVMQAVRESLDMAAGNKLPGSDVAPLFQVLRQFGDAAAVSELESRKGAWPYYAAMALGQMPEGAGIPALVQLASGGPDGGLSALEMLAVAASQYPEARKAILAQARSPGFSTEAWLRLVAPLSGDVFCFQNSVLGNSPSEANPEVITRSHVEFGNQNFFTQPAASRSNPEQASDHLAFLDDLAALAREPVATAALQRARDVFNRRMQEHRGL